MKIKKQKYFGEILQFREMENFCISQTAYSSDAEINFHSHEKPYLCLLVKGSYLEKDHRSSSIITAGNTLFRGANYEHSNRFINFEAICLNIEINDPNHFMEENDFKLPEKQFSRPGSIELYKLLNSLSGNYPNDYMNTLCYESLLMHFDMLPVEGKLDWVRKVKERIHDAPFSPISLSKLSEEFNLHPNYIVRKFKDVTGYRLSEYLNKIRIELSLVKIMQTSDDLTKIAHELGFYDQSHFNRNFKKHFTISPKHFRRYLKG